MGNSLLKQGYITVSALPGKPDAAFQGYVDTDLLLKGDGADPLTDSSPNNYVGTNAGGVTTSATQSKFGGKSLYFSGTSNSSINYNNQADFAFGTGDFTIAFWVYHDNATQPQHIYEGRGSSPTPVIYVNASTYRYYDGTSDRIFGGTFTTNTWTHIALCRKSGVTRMFQNGTQIGSSYTDTNNYVNAANRPLIGCYVAGTGHLRGYLDDFLVIKGTGLYDANFTAPTVAAAQPYPFGIGTTSTFGLYDLKDYGSQQGYLTKSKPAQVRNRYQFYDATFLLNSNGTNASTSTNVFQDVSTYSGGITAFGDVVQCGFTPFSDSTYVGSAYFDGTGDYLQSAAADARYEFGSGNWTWEAWVYPTAIDSYRYIMSHSGGNGGCFFVSVNGTAVWIGNYGGSYWSFATNITANNWYHIAAVRDGANYRLYVNGTAATPTSGPVTYPTARNWRIGISPAADFPWQGFITNVRVVKGTALYSSNFTTPTVPVTQVSGTSLLMNMNNFNGPTDTSLSGRPIKRFGNTQLITATKKFGTASAYFDGTGDALQLLLSQNNTNWNFGTGNFTIDGWVYLTQYNGTNSIIIGALETGTATNFALKVLSTGYASFVGGATTTSAASTQVPLNQWVHLAVVRSGTTVTIYQNGTSVASGTNSNSITASSYNVTVGADNAGDEETLYGYIDDLRVTKGTALYTANFTAPTVEASARPSISTGVSTTTYGIYRLG